MGGENVTTTVEGRERYSVNVRYLRDYRSDMGALERVLVPRPPAAQIPITQLADIRLLEGPSMIRDENGLLSGYVYVDVAGRDLGSYVEEAQRLVRDRWNPSARRLQPELERPVRIPAARARTAEAGGAHHHFPGFHPALPQHPVRGEDADHLCWRCRFPRWAPSGCCTGWVTT